jgi:transposase-like protein
MNTTRRHFTPQEKVAILRRHLVDDVPVSDLCDEYRLQPALFYQWQKIFFENGAAAFEQASKRPKHQTDAKDRKIAQLEAKLAKKNEVVAELMEEHVQLKKELGEL